MRTDHFRYILAERNALAFLLVILVGGLAITYAQSEKESEIVPPVRPVFVGPTITVGIGGFSEYIKATSRTIISRMENVTPVTTNSYFVPVLPYLSQAYMSRFVKYAHDQGELIGKRHVVLSVRILGETERLTESGVYSVVGLYSVRDAKTEKVLAHGAKRYFLSWVQDDGLRPVIVRYTYDDAKEGENAET